MGNHRSKKLFSSTGYITRLALPCDGYSAIREQNIYVTHYFILNIAKPDIHAIFAMIHIIIDSGLNTIYRPLHVCYRRRLDNSCFSVILAQNMPLKTDFSFRSSNLALILKNAKYVLLTHLAIADGTCEMINTPGLVKCREHCSTHKKS